MDPSLASSLTRRDELPPLPPAAAGAVALAEDPAAGSEELRRLVEADPALAARVLEAANSPLYGFAGNLGTIAHAVTVLGFRAVRNLVLDAALVGLLAPPGRLDAAARRLLGHARASAVCARLAARRPGVDLDPEDAFAAGLLHDVGRIAMAAARPRDYEAAVARARREAAPSEAIEREVFGFDHAEAGFEVAVRWGLPRRLATAVRLHHAPNRAADADAGRLASAASVATDLATRLGCGCGARRPGPDLAGVPGYGRLGLLPEDAPALLAAARKACRGLVAGDRL